MQHELLVVLETIGDGQIGFGQSFELHKSGGYGIAYRLAADRGRLASATREQPTDELHEVASSGPTAESAVAARQARALLDEVLASIDIEKRAVFVMYEFDGLPVPDIARAVDVPVPTAHSRLRLARRQFDAGIQRLRAKEHHDPRA